MNRSVLALVLILALPVLVLAAPANKTETSEAQNRLLASLKNLDALVLGQSEGLVREIYAQVRPAMQDGRLRFAVDPAERPLLESIELVNGEKRIDVLVSISLFRADKRRPGLLTGFLSQAMALARNSLVAKVQPYRPDDIQRVYDTMDALYLHARLLRDYNIAQERNLHPLEEYLLRSLSSDEESGLAPMSGSAMMLLGLDAQIIASFAAHGGSARDGVLSAREYLEKVIAVSRRLTEALATASAKNSTASPETRYLAEVSALTMLRFGVGMTNSHLEAFYPGAVQKESVALDALNRSLDELEALARKEKAALGYQTQFLKNLGL